MDLSKPEEAELQICRQTQYIVLSVRIVHMHRVLYSTCESCNADMENFLKTAKLWLTKNEDVYGKSSKEKVRPEY